MNILSLNCLGAHIYRDLLKCSYGNPFIWTRMDNADFIRLLEDYENIDFHNYTLIKESRKLENFRIIIDDKVKLYFNHHLFDANADKPIKRGVDIFYNRIWEYIVDNYEKRLARMTKKIDLIAIDDWSNDIDVKKIKSICERKNYKCFICTNRLVETNEPNMIIKPRLIHDGHGPGPGDIWQDYANEIKEILKNKGEH